MTVPTTHERRSRRAFGLLWGSDAATQVGTAIRTTAIPLIGATTLGLSPVEQGFLVASGTVAFLVVGLPAGAWVDRVRRRPVLIIANLVRALLMAAVVVVGLTGGLTLALLLMFAVLTGCMTVLADVAAPSLLPAIVGRDHLVAANSRLGVTHTAARLGGPGATGLVAQWAGAVSAVAGSALAYLVSTLLATGIRVDEPKPDRAARRSLVAEMREGLAFTFRHPVLRSIAGFNAAHNFFFNIGFALYILFLVRTIGLGEGAVGLLLAVMAAGGLLGAVSTGWWVRRFGERGAMLAATAISQPLTVLIPLADSGWRVVFFVIGSGAFGFGTGVYNVVQTGVRQRYCPDHLLGRMNGSIRFVSFGAIPLGAVAGGAVGALIGLRPGLVVAGIGSALTVLLLIPAVRAPDPESAPNAV